MRKAALLAAVVMAASFTTTTSYAAKKADPAIAAQKNHMKFMMDAFNPYGATNKPAKKGKK